MKAVVLVFAGNITREAFEPLLEGKSAFRMTLEKAALFPYATNIALFVSDADKSAQQNFKSEIKNIKMPVQIISAPAWNTKNFLAGLSRASEGFDFSYFIWGDCPFADVELAAAMQKRHEAYPAEYTYADGFPYGLAPEIFSPGTLGVLCALNGDAEDYVERDTLFNVLQKDINSFDIETEISAVDLRSSRIMLCADSKRNFLLLRRFIQAGYRNYNDAENIIQHKKETLRTLPAFFNIQISNVCPVKCAYCPYPLYKNSGAQNEFKDVSNYDTEGGFISVSKFDTLMNSIVKFTGSAVIDISLWGEAALHPQIVEIADSVLKHEELSLVIETAGLRWNDETLEKLAGMAVKLPQKRSFGTAPLTWIVSLDTNNAENYAALHKDGSGGAKDFDEALLCAEKLFSLFPGNVYVQAIRAKGNEDDIEKFYKHWKTKTNNIIIQKYDSFCGRLPDLLSADISPVIREPCWHIMRDMYILLDGSVPVCKEDICALQGKGEFALLGNAYTETLEDIWKRGEELYRLHCDIIQNGKQWDNLCAKCDEYYTFNF